MYYFFLCLQGTSGSGSKWVHCYTSFYNFAQFLFSKVERKAKVNMQVKQTFLWLQTCLLFLSNAWDFHLFMTWRLLKISNNFSKTSKQHFEHFWSYLKDKNFSVFWFHLDTKGAFLGDDPDQDEWSEITRIMVDQINWWILVPSGFICSFDLPWSERSQITDPAPDHLKGTHPKSSFKAFFEYFREILIEFLLLIMC